MEKVLLLVLLISINAFFAASEIALISLNDNKVKNDALEGDKKSQKLAALLKEPGKFLATIQIGITLAGFLASASASQSFAGELVGLLEPLSLPVSDGVLHGAVVVVITFVLSYFTLVLGELVPKRVAMQHPEKLSRIAIGPLSFISKASAPFVSLLNHSTNFFIRLFGGDPKAGEEKLTEEEIRMMIDVGEEKGAILKIEKELINNIFEFNDKTASDIMTHRTDIVGISSDLDVREAMELFASEKYTRIPVYDENIDNIVGVIHVKDVLEWIIKGEGGESNIKDIMNKPVFVPQSKPIDELFRELQRSKIHMVVVIDEYGGTSGIVTMEDLIEEIVGNIFDEYDIVEDEYKKLGDGRHFFRGTIDLDKVAGIIDLELPVKEYDTLSGYLVGLLGRIPKDGETKSIKNQGLEFKILKVKEKRIEEVEIIKEDYRDS